jgi:hypothetical protein
MGRDTACQNSSEDENRNFLHEVGPDGDLKWIVHRRGSAFREQLSLDLVGAAGIVTPVTFRIKPYFSNTEEAKEPDMSKNHYTTKPKRRNRSGKRKDTRRIAANMAKVKELERSSNRTP